MLLIFKTMGFSEKNALNVCIWHCFMNSQYSFELSDVFSLMERNFSDSKPSGLKTFPSSKL